MNGTPVSHFVVARAQSLLSDKAQPASHSEPNRLMAMTNHTRVARPRPDAASHDDGCGSDDRDIAVTSIADERRARCLRNSLILANVVAWLVALVVVKLFIFS